MPTTNNTGSSSTTSSTFNPVNLRAFVEIQSFINNNPAQVSTLGELSQLSLTYSTTVSENFSTTQTGYRLVSFNCTDTITNQQVAVPQAITDLCISLTDSSVQYSQNNLLPFNAQNYIDSLIVSSNNQISSVIIGNWITIPNILTMPEWIMFTYVPNGSQIKIWLCDQSFQTEYDLYQIVVVPPITPIDTFFQTIGVVQNAVSGVTPSQYIQAIQTAKGIYPETDLIAYSFNYHSPIIGNNPVPTTWTAVVYGQAGANMDSIKQAIQQYIAQNSTHPVSDWQAIFPDIYLQTEFIIIPRWDKYSIPQANTVQGLYASITNAQNDITIATNKTPFYNNTFVAQNVNVMPHYYKYITLLVVNGQNNVSAYPNIQKVFPDYIPQSSNSLDFNRMTPTTQQWTSLLEQMLMIAETMTDLSGLPQGFRRTYRNNIMFLVSTFNNIDYLMLPKSYFTS